MSKLNFRDIPDPLQLWLVLSPENLILQALTVGIYMDFIKTASFQLIFIKTTHNYENVCQNDISVIFVVRYSFG